jgi:hypothetical protein
MDFFSYALAQCPPGRALPEFLRDSVFFELKMEFFSSMKHMHLLNVLLAELSRTP